METFIYYILQYAVITAYNLISVQLMSIQKLSVPCRVTHVLNYYRYLLLFLRIE